MKKIIKILLICLIIAGTIVIATVGLNVGLKYSANTQININIGKEFEIKDIEDITNEVFKNKRVIIQQVELYKDMLQITVEEVSEEQLNDLNAKINEKYEINNDISDLEVITNTNVRLRNIINPYILPILIVSIIVILISMIIYRKLGIWSVLYIIAINIVVPQAILVSIYAVTRLPINRLTPIIAIIVYMISIILSIIYMNKLKENRAEKDK